MQSIFVTVVLCFFGIFIVYGSPIDSQNATEAIKAVTTKQVTTNSTDTVHTTEQKPEKKSVNYTLPVNGTVVKNETSSPITVTSKPVPQAFDNSSISVITTTTNETAVTKPTTPTSIDTAKTDKPVTEPVASSPKASITTTTKSPPAPTTTERPNTSVVTEKALARPDRAFDGPSFIGGIVLALGLTGIGFVAYKFCKGRTDRPYRNL